MHTRSHGSSRSYVSGSITNLRVVVCIYIIMGSLACGVCIILCFGIPSQHSASSSTVSTTTSSSSMHTLE